MSKTRRNVALPHRLRDIRDLQLQVLRVATRRNYCGESPFWSLLADAVGSVTVMPFAEPLAAPRLSKRLFESSLHDSQKF